MEHLHMTRELRWQLLTEWCNLRRLIRTSHRLGQYGIAAAARARKSQIEALFN